MTCWVLRQCQAAGMGLVELGDGAIMGGQLGFVLSEAHSSRFDDRKFESC